MSYLPEQHSLLLMDKYQLEASKHTPPTRIPPLERQKAFLGCHSRFTVLVLHILGERCARGEVDCGKRCEQNKGPKGEMDSLKSFPRDFNEGSILTTYCLIHLCIQTYPKANLLPPPPIKVSRTTEGNACFFSTSDILKEYGPFPAKPTFVLVCLWF